MPSVLNIYLRDDKKPQVWRCPADIGEGVFGGSWIPYWKSTEASYGFPGINYKSGGYPYLAGLRLSNLMPTPAPTTYVWIWQLPLSRRPMIYDRNCFHKLLAIGTHSDRLSAVGSNNVIFCDGHVGSVENQRFQNLLFGTSELK